MSTEKQGAWQRLVAWIKNLLGIATIENVPFETEAVRPAPGAQGASVSSSVADIRPAGPAGATAVDDIAALYLRYGEAWEGNQALYVEAFSGKELQFEAALDRVNIPAMVASWSDATIKARAGDVPTLSFNGQQRAALARAINAEAHKRFSPPPAKHNGMTE